MNTGKKSAPYWDGLNIVVDAALADAVSNFLMERTMQGVQTTDLPDQRVEIVVYVEEGTDIRSELSATERYLKRLAELHPDLRTGTVRSFRLEDGDWAERWKESFKPLKVGERLVICPSWEEYQAAPQELVVVMDPGMAFGTGQHETTTLCLEALQDLFALKPGHWRDREVAMLDVGCGSGILAMAGLMLGANRALAVDNEPLAVEASRENAIRNRLASRMEVRLISVEDLEGRYQIIAANIQLNTLVKLAATLRICLTGEACCSSRGFSEISRKN